ncbi:MAG: S41 family peptidase [Gemmatimonadota bacterium]|nr:S41 family peptidase [Gemmatimonadota bacterium]MDH3424677.1 S41 family peptidase [Gemmatimonadota bacterium]
MQQRQGPEMSRSVAAPAMVVLLSAIAGAWLLQRGIDRSDNMYVQVRVLQEVVDRVESSFVEEVDGESLFDTAIDAIIGQLGDPNTSFIQASEYENLRIRTEGEYGGVGLEVTDGHEYVTVVGAIPGGPGERVGIRAGDRFFEIDGVAADTMLTDQAVALLRGRPGTDVRIKMLRPGLETPIEFTIQRAVIRLMAVPFSLMLDETVGYVPLSTVQETSSAEVSAALDSLQGLGMTGLVFDLRRNPGGLLDEGIAVTDLFLDPGQAIVETRGRARGQNGTYDASRPDRYPGLPIVVLVDGGSASAAEIIAGALQDHDRAVVLGETTYGKGSVQSLFPLTGGDVLRLTTARWYTPLGRSIHLDRTEAPEPDGQPLLALSGQALERADLEGRPEYRTPSGRLVYGGGGIPPDLYVAPLTLTPAEVRGAQRIFMSAGAFSQAIFNGSVSYLQAHPNLQEGFSLSDADLDVLFAEFSEWEAEVSREDFDLAERYVRYHLEREIALQAWGDAGQFQQSRRYDTQLMRALELLAVARTPADLLELVGVAGAGTP